MAVKTDLVTFLQIGIIINLTLCLSFFILGFSTAFFISDNYRLLSLLAMSAGCFNGYVAAQNFYHLKYRKVLTCKI